MSLVATIPVSGSTVAIQSSVGDMWGTYGGNYVGMIPAATLDTNPIDGGVICLDYTTTTTIPNGGFDVYVGTLDPVDLSNAKFAGDPVTAADILKYQQAAVLIGQLASNPTQTGEINFAIWRIFSTVPYGSNPATEDFWSAWVIAENMADYDFSTVRIYTPYPDASTNQEFMSGAGIPIVPGPVPLPGAIWLFASGLLGLVAIRRRTQK